MALSRPLSVSSMSKGSSWPAKVNTRSVRGPKPALCICVRFSVRPSEKVMVSWSGVYLVQILKIYGVQKAMMSQQHHRDTSGRFQVFSLHLYKFAGV